MNRHRVLVFARYAELFGAEVVEVELAPDARVSDLVLALRQAPGGESLPAVPLIALDHRKVSLQDPLGTPKEIALLPPLAGG